MRFLLKAISFVVIYTHRKNARRHIRVAGQRLDPQSPIFPGSFPASAPLRALTSQGSELIGDGSKSGMSGSPLEAAITIRSHFRAPVTFEAGFSSLKKTTTSN